MRLGSGSLALGFLGGRNGDRLGSLVVLLGLLVSGGLQLAGTQQDVVPREELLGIGSVHTLRVVVGQHLAHQVKQHLALDLLGVEVRRFGFQHLVDAPHHLFEGFLTRGGEHAYLAQGADIAGREDWEFLSVHEVLDDGTAFGAGDKFVQVGLAGDG